MSWSSPKRGKYTFEDGVKHLVRHCCLMCPLSVLPLVRLALSLVQAPSAVRRAFRENGHPYKLPPKSNRPPFCTKWLIPADSCQNRVDLPSCRKVAVPHKPSTSLCCPPSQPHDRLPLDLPSLHPR
ncbi:hypothetical protein ARMGADRAFT_324902 [Armillaria gallica]|uniref:Uncharacterized protein n=1 Tax=Armillaria gallica TaxID=47427 RepID=A0A2H3D608_ARMGA|nr:hypothetical protein ARMGADRAFT_324902 [Armillaria gallica]